MTTIKQSKRKLCVNPANSIIFIVLNSGINPYSCQSTAWHQHRQVNLGQDKLSPESYVLACTLTGNTLGDAEGNLDWLLHGNITFIAYLQNNVQGD